jgi:cell division protein FtsI (penicillin-binding protein 3)
VKRPRTRPIAGKLPVWRLRLLLALFGCAFLVLLGRAVYLQGYNDRFLQAKGESRYSRVIEIPANRGRILDRNGEALAVSAPVRSVWAIPDELKADGKQLGELARLLESTPRELRRKLGDEERDFVYLKRQLPPEVADRVAELRIPGVFQSREYRRYYPGGEVMAHVLGFTGVDDTGQEGVELAFQDALAGRPGSRRVIKDRRGQIVEDVESIRAAQPGRDVVLAIDARIQHLAFQHLRQAVTTHRAKGGGIVVIDVGTGELLALANLPTYNPNNRTGMQGAQLRNRVVTDAFEPGSTLKPFTVALALDTGKVKPETVIQTAPGSLTIGSATIRDAHAAGALTVAQVIQKSSNVGSAKIALGLRPDEMWRLFSDVGFGAQPRLGFPGESPGRVRAVKTWKPVEQATMSYGHGISVSLVQLARAYTMFARDGELVPLSLTRLDSPPPAKRVLAAGTARDVRRMLELAAGPGGTAPRAQVMGYRVAGKTGTAHKLVDGVYSPNRYLSSFVGFAPVSNPRLVIAVMIDEPGAGDYYGGLVAAPVFASVMGGALRVLGVTPDAPMKPIELPSVGSEVEESL